MGKEIAYNPIQHKDYLYFITEDNVKKYLRFDFGIAPTNSLPSNVVIGNNGNEGYAILWKRQIDFMENKMNATILNNENDFTTHVHGVYEAELNELFPYLDVESFHSEN